MYFKAHGNDFYKALGMYEMLEILAWYLNLPVKNIVKAMKKYCPCND